jgi:hypothetical protein
VSRDTKRRIFLAAWSAAFVLAVTVPVLAFVRGTVWIGPTAFHARTPLHHPLLSVGADVWLPHGSSAVVIAVLGRIHAEGRLSDDVANLGGPIYLQKGTIVERDVVSIGDAVYRAPEVRITGRVGGQMFVWNGSGSPGRLIWPLDLWHFSRLSFAAGLALLLICTCIAVAFPWQTVVVANNLFRGMLRSALAGLMGIFLFVFLAVPLGMSLFGLPFALLLAVAAAAAWLLGLTAAAVTIGRYLACWRGHEAGLLWAVVSGMFASALVLAVPVIGPLLVGLAGTTGAGSLALIIVDRARPGAELPSVAMDETSGDAGAYIESGRR